MLVGRFVLNSANRSVGGADHVTVWQCRFGIPGTGGARAYPANAAIGEDRRAILDAGSVRRGVSDFSVR